MKISPLATLAAAALALPLIGSGAFADNAEAGAKVFNKCKACHSIVAPDGTAVVKGGKVGPNLYGVIGRTVGSEEGFKYSKSILEVNALGTVWDEAELAAYVVDPTAWIKDKSGDAAAKSAMTFKLPKGGEDVAAYLASVAQ
jgi:cytochrome c